MTAVREAKEEYGLDITPADCHELMIMKYSFGEDARIFICQLRGNPKVTMSEGSWYKWMDISEIKKLDLGWEQDAVLPILEEFLRRIATPVKQYGN